ncbi:3-dehydroquinate synthase [Kytococcus sedentarius]|uniref:3-dehydroquinate synthase n=1 Tax=Kytococcus sedentarius TaxID=1276 RepID=UPI0038793ACC
MTRRRRREFGWFSHGAPQQAGWHRTGRLPWQRVYLEPTPAEVVLIGPPGVGKSSVAELLAGSSRTVIDTDAVVVERAGCSIPEIFERHGQEHFRALEAEVVREAVTTNGGSPRAGGVVSLGGGAVMTPAVQEVLREHAAAGRPVVWLQVDPEAMAERLGEGGRPLLAGDPEEALTRWRTLEAARRDTYAELATHVIDTTGRPAHEVAAVLRQRLDEPLHGPVAVHAGLRVSVSTSTGQDYPVAIGHRALRELPDLLTATGGVPHRALVVHQPGVQDAVESVADTLTALGTQVHRHRIEPAEPGKSLAGVAGIWEACAGAGLDRHDLLVAVGGGAATDVTGFAAATWMRGVDVVHVPTTLLAMVDASVGGKTGINTAAGKNLVGAFHQPRAVVADLDLLGGLPTEDVRAGLAEVVKCGYIDSADLDGWEILDLVRQGARSGEDPRDWPFLAELVRRALRVKARAVAADTREAGVREHLNFGHTLGHALEKVEAYRLRHGDAVAIGMVYGAALGEELDLWPGTQEVRELLTAVGLPTHYRGAASWTEVRAAMAGDKKARAGTLRFVLLAEACEPVTREVADEEALERAWGAVSRP